MPLPRFTKLDPARQEAILAAARTEFAAHGYAQASYNAIIKDAGLSKGAMYYYFADKADLCRTVVERTMAGLPDAAGELGAFDDATGFWRALHGMVERVMAFVMSEPDILDLARLAYDEQGSSEVLQPLIDGAEQWCAGALRQGQRVGAVRDDVPLPLLATMVTGLLVHADRWIAGRLDQLDEAELTRLSFACLAMVEQLAAPPQGSTK